MKRLLFVAAVALAVARPAIAADLPEAAPLPPPPPQAPAAYIPTVAPVYNWGGVYLGVNGGYGFGNSSWSSVLAKTGNFNVSGFAFGGTVGANYQMDAFVFGIDGDIDYMGVSGTSSICTPNSCETKNTWLSTFRARAGYAADRVLFYGTGGGALGNIEANGPSGWPSSSKLGWTAGAGVEAAFADSLTARIEYLFVDLQNAQPFSAGAPVAQPITVKLDESLIRFGLDYKFR